MGFWNRLATGALGVGEFAVKVAWDTGSVLVSEGHKVYKDYQRDKDLINATLNTAGAIITTTALGAASAVQRGVEVGGRCYVEIQEDYEKEAAENRKLEEERRILREKAEIEYRKRREAEERRLAAIREEAERKKKEKELFSYRYGSTGGTYGDDDWTDGGIWR